MATALLLLAAGLQLVLPPVSSLPTQSDRVPRRAREPLAPVAANYPEILRNPIFAPDRKADASIEPPAGGMGDFSVLGIATAGTSTATAVVRMPDGTIARIQPGADLGGWKLVQVDLNALTFEKNGERHILSIEKKPAPVVAPPAPNSGAPAAGGGP